MGDYRFSVLMAFYHGDEPVAFRQSLQSLAAQTLQADQIVLVQDGPVSQELAAVAEGFIQTPVTLVTLPENRGLSHALNAGLGECQYDWVARMDSDDVALPDRFEKQISFLKAHPEIDVFGGQIQEFTGTPHEWIGRREVPLQHDAICRFMRHRNPMNHMTVMFRRTAVSAVGGYPVLQGMEDYLLWARLAAAGYRFENLSNVLVNARGEQLMKRRGGWPLVKSEYRMQQQLRQLQLVGGVESFSHFAVRGSLRLLPSSILKVFYKYFLRQSARF